MFESVASLKQKTDQEDKYLICDINRDCNNWPAYIFKTSKFLLNLAYRLVRQAGDYLPTEFPPTAHTRDVKGLKL